MKNIIEYINEASDVKVKFQGQEFTMDRMILSNVHHDLQMASEVDSFTEDMWKDLKKQGVKYILTIPPHYYSEEEKNDVFIIKMFIKRKKIYDMYEHSEAYALYDVKTHECVNKDIMQKGRAYKIIRFE